MRYCACIGNFDGVHLGHQKLIKETVECAKQYNLIPAVITFDPDPMQYFSDYKDKMIELSKITDKSKISGTSSLGSSNALNLSNFDNLKQKIEYFEN